MPKAIRNGIIGGAALTALTIVNTVFPFITGVTLATMVGFLAHAYAEGANITLPSLRGSSLYLILNVVNILLVAGLTFGLYRKNRWCAILLFSYGILYLILNVIMTFTGALWLAATVVITIAILIAIVQGMRGIFFYHHDYL